MTFYIIIIPPTLFAIYMLFKLRHLKKHDDVLFRFCELRRKTMRYVRAKTTKIPREDYIELRELIGLLNSTIHNYEDHKKGLFQVKNLSIEAKNVYRSVKNVEKKSIYNNKKIQSFYQEYGKIMLIAFLNYTLFLKSKFIVIILIKILGVFVNHAGAFLKDYFKRHLNFLKWLNGETRKFNLDITK